MNNDAELAAPSEGGNVSVGKPTLADLSAIGSILRQWIQEDEAETYIGRIKAECEGTTEYGMAFYALRQAGEVIGVGGLADPLPSVAVRAESSAPGELKILYLRADVRGRGFGGSFIKFLEREAVRLGRTELLVRSAEQFRETAFEFYRQAGYEDLGQIMNSAGRPMQLFRKLLIAPYEN